MKKSTIIIHSIFFLIIFTGSSVSYAGGRPGVVEMADGNYIIFPTTTEKTTFHTGTNLSSERLKPANSVGSNKSALVFEMAESGITVSFPLREEEGGTNSAGIIESVVPSRTILPYPNPDTVKIELAESGYFILFFTGRDELDQKNQHYYNQIRHQK